MAIVFFESLKTCRESISFLCCNLSLLSFSSSFWTSGSSNLGLTIAPYFITAERSVFLAISSGVYSGAVSSWENKSNSIISFLYFRTLMYNMRPIAIMIVMRNSLSKSVLLWKMESKLNLDM